MPASHRLRTAGSGRAARKQAVTRVPELVPIRYGRMLVSPFTFYRGAALLMAADLAASPRSGITTQLCGDAHLMNFGVFASPERQLVFGINDFDETFPGPWEWDVKRLAASFAIAGRDIGFSAKDRKKVLLTLVGAYRRAMREFAGMTNLAVWYSHSDVERSSKDFDHESTASLASGPRPTSPKRALVTACRPSTSSPTWSTASAASSATLRSSSRSRSCSRASSENSSWTGSGHGAALPTHPAERPSAPARGLPGRPCRPQGRRRRERRHAGLDRPAVRPRRRRSVVPAGQGGAGLGARGVPRRAPADLARLTCRAGPAPHAGDQRHLPRLRSIVGLDGVERDFYVRQLRDWKGAAVVETMAPTTLAVYARLCAWSLARAHARSGDRVAIGTYLGSSDIFDRAIAEFSESYADQNERDYAALVQAEKDGRITARHGL